jgi:putative FmdB family regulatory protein
MPTYEYLCQTCSHRFETWQRMADEPLTVCPECGNHIRRVLYPAGIVFKGSGFYKTDHGNGARPTSNGNGEGKKADSTGTEAPASNGSKPQESSADTVSKPAESSASTTTGVK